VQADERDVDADAERELAVERRVVGESFGSIGSRGWRTMAAMATLAFATSQRWYGTYRQERTAQPVDRTSAGGVVNVTRPKVAATTAAVATPVTTSNASTVPASRR
jgi:hypothetical protein